MNTIIEVFKSLLEQYRCHENIEIECRLGWKPNNEFITDIGEKFFNSIVDVLNTSNVCTKKVEHTDIYIYKNLRITTKHNSNDILKIEKKKKLKQIDLSLIGTPYDLRISVCQEIPSSETPNLYHCEKIRSKNRTTYEYKMWNYDLTRVNLYNTNQQSLSCSNRIYECDI